MAARQAPWFKLGKKQVFLPDHVIIFLRKKHLPPNEACFQVPLRFTKFDLRDYLWNLYEVETLKVRSYVKQQPLARRPSSSNSFYRPQALKIMNVELAKPFQWPDVPDNLEPWSVDLWKKREEVAKEGREDRYDRQSGKIPLISEKPPSKERKDLAALAKQMLSGEVQWKSDAMLDPKWDARLSANAQSLRKASEDGSASR